MSKDNVILAVLGIIVGWTLTIVTDFFKNGSIRKKAIKKNIYI